MSKESEKLLQLFLYQLASEIGKKEFGEEAENATELYQKTATELSQLFFFQDQGEFPTWVANKLEELAPNYGIEVEE